MASVSNTTTNGAEALYQTLNGNSQKTETKKSAGEEMQDRFLTLLMAQIRSQDPLNPMENAEFTSQLAQMNTVIGIEKLNSSLNTLLAGYGEAQAMQAAQHTQQQRGNPPSHRIGRQQSDAKGRNPHNHQRPDQSRLAPDAVTIMAEN